MEGKRGETKPPIQTIFKGMESTNSLSLSCNPLTKHPLILKNETHEWKRRRKYAGYTLSKIENAKVVRLKKKITKKKSV